MTWFYKILNLPHVPQDIIDQAYTQINVNLDQTTGDKPKIDWNKIKNNVIIVDGVKKINAPNMGYNLDDSIKEWVYKHITDIDVANVRISVTDTGNGKDTNGAHCDLSRNYSMIYLLENGGPNHKTVFYLEKDKPIMRNNGDRCNDYGLLTEIDSFQIPLRTWTIIKTRVLHGDINIPNPRISFQVGLNSLIGLGLDD